MLVMNRSIGETVIIDNEVYVTCLGSNENGEVVLGFDAPKSVPVERLEMHLLKEKTRPLQPFRQQC